MKVHTHVEGKFRLRTTEEHVLGGIRLEKDAGHVSNEHVLLSLVLDRLD